jgi:hypothetical protein
MLRQWLFRGMFSGLMIALLASVLLAKPGTVTTNQGDTFKGDVTEDDQFYYIKSAGGQIKLDKRNAKVEYTETIDDQYLARHAKLKDNDVKGRIELAQWANQNGRADLAVAALTEARKIDPMNKEAGTALDSAEAQLELDQANAKAKKPAVAATQPATGGTPDATAPVTPAPAVAAAPPLERRLLTDDEINIIRQKEMKADDAKVKVKLENGVAKKYLATGGHDAAAFNKLSAEGQALEILANGTPEMAKDVRITTDPAPLADFKTRVYPLIASGCASTACHGGMKAGNLSFFPKETTAGLYTDFYILQTYSTTIDGTKYLLMDRDVPKHSLVLQYGLPQSVGIPPHPKVPGFRPRFKSDSDQPFADVSDWLTTSLQLPQPDYGIKVSAKLPATQPTAPVPAKP